MLPEQGSSGDVRGKASIKAWNSLYPKSPLKVAYDYTKNKSLCYTPSQQNLKGGYDVLNRLLSLQR